MLQQLVFIKNLIQLLTQQRTFGGKWGTIITIRRQHYQRQTRRL